MINPITKIDTNAGPVVIDLSEIVMVRSEGPNGLTMLTRGSDYIILHVADPQTLVEDMYAKIKKIREDNLQILADMGAATI